MKLFKTEKGFYEMIEEARAGKTIYCDYETCKSDYVTTRYETDDAIYVVVENLENGTYYNVEKIEKN